MRASVLFSWVRTEDTPSAAFSGMEKLDMQDVLSRIETRGEKCMVIF